MAERTDPERGGWNAVDDKPDSRGRIWSRFSLRRRLLLLTALALFPAFLIVIANHLSSRAMRSAEVDAYAVQMTEIVQNEVLRGLTAAGTLMIAMGRSAIVQEHDAADCEAYTAGIMRDLPTVIDIAVADASGRVYCHTGISATAALQAAVDALAADPNPGVELGNYTATPGGPALPLGMPLRGADGAVEGYIQLLVNLSELTRQVTAATRGIESTTTVTDRDGTVLLRLPEGDVQPGQPAPGHLAEYVHAEAPGAVRLTGPDGVPKIIGYRPVTEALPIATLFALPEAPAMAPIDRAGIAYSLIALAGAALAFLLAWFIGTVFIRTPVNALNRAVAARRAGDRSARTGLGGDASEFGLIGRSLDHLFDELDRREEAQRRAEEQRDLYAREVQHRVKNLLAIIQVIARQTLSRADSSPEVATFENRISAIIRANSRLLAQDEGAGQVEDLVREAITPFVEADDHRVAVGGPSLRLRSKTASALAMALHELATNAVKYGALRDPGGRLEIHWRADADRFELTWTERDGPPVAAPTETGFGSIVISRVLEAETRGKVTVEYPEEGLRFRFTAPLGELRTEPS